MFLADRDIKKRIEEGSIIIDPYDESQLQSAAYDLRLFDKFRVFKSHITHIDVKEEHEITKLVPVAADGSFILHPRQFVLASTMETITIPNDLVGVLEGRSSLARLGLIVHATASFINPGARMQITFEMTNLSHLPVKVYAGMRVAQLAFAQLSQPAEKTYTQLTSKYQDQSAPMPSMIWKDFE